MNDWPHQLYGVSKTRELLNAGLRRLCLTSPTGGGKSLMVRRMIEWGHPTVVYANRVMLVEQLARGLDEAGLPYGMQASGYAPSVFENVQIASIQTVSKRMEAKRMEPHDAYLVVIDEWHNEKSDRCQKVMDWHLDRGASVVGITATPVGLGEVADALIVAGVTSELRKCGALVAAQTYAPDEPDTRAFKTTTKGIIQFRDEVKEVMLKVIFGRVIEHYHKLNPDQRPAILFAPGVQESRWFCEQFNEAGVPWSHIDSKHIVLNGHEMPATKENRELLKAASESGRTKGVSNRFVMREGVDWPHLYHGIFACTFGSVSSYIQAGGRLLRAHPSLNKVIIQDHGANFWRHDSLNADREWSLDDTDKSIQEKHDEKYRTKAEAEPIVCPKCSKVRGSGATCPACGFAYTSRKRIVVQTDGTLREVRGDIYKPRRVNTSPDAHKKWKACVYRCMKTGKTFSQARGLYMHENHGTVPGPDFPMAPKFESDWALPVKDVPRSRLTGGEQ